ncbi:hypothetical protein B0H10DRAFT_1648280, partial [Mycena sp. CBHHK59/15]
LRYLIGFLKKHGIKVQKQCLHKSMTQVDGLGQVLRQHKTIEWWEYTSPRPNSTWHMDGHHKLIKWGIVIHGIIDGYNRMVGQHI